ncbi:PQQ-dependent sugar dehydrogenase [Streptomyces silvensis]|uniref:Oxidoreductase n=1 Tax=Streptomyces silvensis TaxID=1765722 RepID=A0A0W7WVI4_9ACTN|nr:PQQ-dependent sugar dehydrogenase [Streptomyces silvensis]KUF14519.1 oxidoreductase [Streptomyces silvensis]
MHGSTRSTRTTRRTVPAAVAALAAGLLVHVPAAGGAAAAPPAPAGEPTGVTTLSTGWTIPWGTAWLPDGKSALITERDGFGVWSLAADGSGKKQVGKVPEAQTTGGEGGLMGIAVDPQWADNHHVYVMHTAAEGNRIARMTYDGATLGEYTVLLKGIKKARYHNGGRLAFGPDGHLYATTGDAQDRPLAQDRNSLNGKILRMTKDGKPAPGNPFGNHVYSLGHRNPQGIAFDPQGRLWEAELGDASRDELNLIKPGRNYGWPTCEGTCNVAGMTNPKTTWAVTQASPSGVAVVDGAVYMAALRGQRLWRVPINADNENVGTPKAFYVGQYGRLRAVTAVPGATALWLSTTNADNMGGQPDGVDKILRATIG